MSEETETVDWAEFQRINPDVREIHFGGGGRLVLVGPYHDDTPYHSCPAAMEEA